MHSPCLQAIVLAFFLTISYTRAEVDARAADGLLENALDLATAINSSSLTQSALNNVMSAAAFAKSNGCNLNVCFALDGSNSVGRRNYELQKQFVLLIAAIIGADEDSAFAAVQYGVPMERISAIERDASRFLERVRLSNFRNSNRVLLAGGLSFCTTIFRTRTDEVNKIVVLGDGQSKFGGRGGPLGPVGVAKTFRDLSPGNSVCAVAVGFEEKPQLFLDVVGNNPRLVIRADGWPTVLNKARTLVRQICERASDF